MFVQSEAALRRVVCFILGQGMKPSVHTSWWSWWWIRVSHGALSIEIDFAVTIGSYERTARGSQSQSRISIRIRLDRDRKWPCDSGIMYRSLIWMHVPCVLSRCMPHVGLDVGSYYVFKKLFVLLSPVADVYFIDAKVRYCCVVAILQSTFNSFELEANSIYSLHIAPLRHVINAGSPITLHMCEHHERGDWTDNENKEPLRKET